jgi:hypothetical protein
MSLFYFSYIKAVLKNKIKIKIKNEKNYLSHQILD